MTDQAPRPDGTGFSLASGELTVAGSLDQAVDVSVTAGLFGGDGLDVVLASFRAAQDLATVRTEGGHSVLPLRTQPLMLNSLPSSVRVQLTTAAGSQHTEGSWELTLHFRNRTGAGLTLRTGLPAEAFGTGWMAPLADLLTVDGADHAIGDAGESPAVAVVHHADDEYYEVLVDGHRAGVLVYHVIGSHLSITHTIVEQDYRGRGLSWVLVGGALDDIRTRSVTVSNYCAVVGRFVDKNPEYGDLLSTLRPA